MRGVAGTAMKRIPRPPSELPYVVDRLRRNVELDRRFYIKAAERGLSEFIRTLIGFVTKNGAFVVRQNNVQ